MGESRAKAMGQLLIPCRVMGALPTPEETTFLDEIRKAGRNQLTRR